MYREKRVPRVFEDINVMILTLQNPACVTPVFEIGWEICIKEKQRTHEDRYQNKKSRNGTRIILRTFAKSSSYSSDIFTYCVSVISLQTIVNPNELSIVTNGI